MNESNRTVREAASEVAVEILGVLGTQPQEMESNFGEGSAGAAIELRLTQFARAILEQAQRKGGNPIAHLKACVNVNNLIRTMNDPPLDDTVGARMQGIRCEIDQDLEDVSASARSMVDWRHYVKTYPWACLGTAAVLGFLVVPKRSAATDTEAVAPTEAAKNGHPVVNSPPTAKRRLVDMLVTAVVSVAIRETIAYVGPSRRKIPGNN